MSITATKKSEVIKDFGTSDSDSGSPQVQVAILTHRINELTDHFRAHKHDHSSRRGLLQMVARRNKLLRYLRETNRQAYLELIGRLGLRK